MGILLNNFGVIINVIYVETSKNFFVFQIVNGHVEIFQTQDRRIFWTNGLITIEKKKGNTGDWKEKVKIVYERWVLRIGIYSFTV